MNKRILRSISAIMVLVMLTELLPVSLLGNFVQRVRAEEAVDISDGYSYNTPEYETDLSEVVIPPTVIISEETANLDEELQQAQENLVQTTDTSTETDDILCAPYLYQYGEHEKVDLNKGVLNYEEIDFVLPGRNGLDLVIGRRYSSNSVLTSDGLFSLNPNFGFLTENWRLMFSFCKKSTNMISLSDGRTFQIDSDGKLVGNTTEDEIIVKSCRTNDTASPSPLFEPPFYNGQEYATCCAIYKDGKREYFSSNGYLIGITDRYGNTITFVHEGSFSGWRKTTITDTLGRIIELTASQGDGSSTLTISLPDNKQLSYNFTIDQAPVLASATDCEGNTTQYSYTYRIGWEQPSLTEDIQLQHYYTLTTVTHPNLSQTIFDYETVSTISRKYYKLSSREDQFNGNVSNHVTYYTSQPTSTVTHESGLIIRSTFNPLGLLTEEVYGTECTTFQEILYAYGLSGNKCNLPTSITTNTYGPESDEIYFTSIRAYSYDSKGNVTEEWSPLADGNQSNHTYKTTYTYDETYSILLRKTYQYDLDSTVTIQNTLDDDNKSVIRTEISLNGTPKSRIDYAYDIYGNVTSEKQYLDNFTDYILSEYIYDEASAYLIQEKHSGILTADGGSAVSSPGQAAGTIVTNYTYDAFGHMSSCTDGSGNTTGYSYNALGNVTQITRPDNATVSYAWNYVQNTVTVTDENGAQIKYTYTPMGLEFETVDVQTCSVMSRKEYDAQSRLIKVSDFVYGAVTEYTYDVLDRVTSETVKQGDEILSQTLYAYDDAAENGLYQKVTKTVVGDENAPSIVTTQYTDKNGNVVKTGKFLNGVEYFDTATYDYVGNVITQLTAADAAKNLPFTAKYEYNVNGQVTKTWNAENQYTTNTYDALGRLVQTTDYAGTPTTYTYDALGRLLTQTITISDGVTATSKYDYDASGNIIREWKPVNAVGTAAAWSKTEYAYDSRQNLISVKQYNGSQIASETGYTYDAVGNLLTMTASGNTTTYTYDRFGNTLSMADALGQAETYTYSSLGKPLTKTDRNGNVTTYAFDALGRPVSTVVGTGDDQEAVQYTYTKTGQIRTEENGWQRTTYTYDELGQVVQVAEAELNLLPIILYHTVTLDPNGGAVTPTSVEVAEGGVYDLPVPTRTGYGFDGWYWGETLISNGDSVQLTEDATFTAHWTANAYTVVYHGNGGQTENGLTETTEVWAYGQDVTLSQNPFTRTGWTFQGWGTSAGGEAVYTGGQGPLQSLTAEPNGQVHLYAIWQELPSSTVTLDPNGGEVTPAAVQVVTGTYFTPPTPTRTGYTFQGWYLGEILISNGDPVTVTEACTLTAHWSPISYTVVYDPNGGAVPLETHILMQSCTYDQDVTLISNPFIYEGKTFYGWSTSALSGSPLYSAGQTVRNLTSVPNGSVTLYAVWTTSGSIILPPDPDEPVVMRYTRSSAAPTDELISYTKTYSYDLAGNRVGFQLVKSGETVQNVSYTYDDLNRLSTVSEGGSLQATYTYNANGNRASLTYSNGTVETYTYNLANWITGLENKKGSETLSSFSYTYYASGSQKSETDHTGKVTGYVYDGLGRLTQESETNGLTVNYNYDAAGNRSQMAVTGAETYTTVYTYDANNRLLTESKTENGETVTTTYTYDANGNTLTKSTPAHGEDEASSTTYTYNGFNQLIALTVDGTSVAYAYNAQGIRTAKRVNNTRIAFLLDGGNVVAEVQNNTVTDNYLRGVNLIRRTSGSETEYYLFNAHGDVVTTTNLNGTVNQEYDYDAFGNEKDLDALDTNPFRYCGEYLDFETGDYYLRARYYDPTIGRFTQMDSVLSVTREMPNGQKITDPLSLNLYTYVHNSPLLYRDPSGHWIESVWDAANILLDAYDIYVDLCAENYWTFLLDVGALIGDVVALSVPLIPGGFGTLKTPTRAGRTLKAFDKIRDCIDAGKKLGITAKSFLRKEARRFLSENSSAFAKAIADGIKLDVHHLIPLEWAHIMGAGFDPNMLDNLVGVSPEIHKEINKMWASFKKNLAGEIPTADEILEFVEKVRKKYGEFFIR